ncbi:MAG: ParB-like protein partition protein, partial [Candidatus Nomurabacteria bacterium GW2011_GWC2_41_8]
MSNTYSNSIFWIDTDKIKPNPLQPRRDFDEARLQDLADSIKQYGVLQPLTVSRVEVEKEGGGLVTEYELIAGERRLRAAKLALVLQVPVIIRTGDTAIMKLELAIIENLQREDLNAVDRARAFFRLVSEFKFTHNEIAKKMGRSREYVSNSLRILTLPEEILELTKILWPGKKLSQRKDMLESIYRWKAIDFDKEPPAEVIAYNNFLRERNLFDFDDLLLESLPLIPYPLSL